MMNFGEKSAQRRRNPGKLKELRPAADKVLFYFFWLHTQEI